MHKQRVERGGEGDDDKAQREGGGKPPPTIHPAVVLKKGGERFFRLVPLPNPRIIQPAGRFPEPRTWALSGFSCTPPISVIFRAAFVGAERRDPYQGGGVDRRRGSSLSADARNDEMTSFPPRVVYIGFVFPIFIIIREKRGEKHPIYYFVRKKKSFFFNVGNILSILFVHFIFWKD